MAGLDVLCSVDWSKKEEVLVEEREERARGGDSFAWCRRSCFGVMLERWKEGKEKRRKRVSARVICGIGLINVDD